MFVDRGPSNDGYATLGMTPELGSSFIMPHAIGNRPAEPSPESMWPLVRNDPPNRTQA